METQILKNDNKDKYSILSKQYFVILLVTLSLFCKMFYLNYTVISYEFLDARMLIGNFLFILALVAWSIFIPQPKQFLSLLIINILFTTYIIANLYYFRYFADVFSFKMIMYSSQIVNVADSVKYLASMKDLILFIDILLLLAIYFFVSFQLKRKKREPQVVQAKKEKIVITLCILIITFVTNFLTINSFDKNNPNALASVWDKIYVATGIGIPNYHILDLKSFITEKTQNKPLLEEEVKEIAAFLEEKNRTNDDAKKLWGFAQNKNLLIIQVESLQKFVINRSINDLEITPNLNRLVEENMYFSNIYGQTAGGNTSDAEFMANTSLYPIANGAVFVKHAHNDYNSLAAILKERDYKYTAMMHAYKPSFWNRSSMYNSLQVDRFFSFEDYVFDEHIGLGLSDASFYRQSLDKLKEMEKPFMALLSTLTSHHPYSDVEKYGDFYTGELEGSLLGNYIKSIHYADQQLGNFIEELKKNGIWEESLVVIYGDHPGIPSNHRDELYEFLDIQDGGLLSWELLQQIPLIINIPNENFEGNYEIAGGLIDVFPTVLNLLGLEANVVFGKDLINSEEGFVVFRDGSFATDDYYYFSSQRVLYNIETGEQEDFSIVQKKVDLAKMHLSSSDKIIENDLIPVIEQHIDTIRNKQ
ncbi:LTA synthase family protein [Clostridium formicaceticum]|uniref:Lipoteichoic acid synthase 2 n=1 Tax=Clostridium formicaceticum TaxID=1497 RepID=A0AAC9WEK3_9CLOT|nr:LTA synthase family protein [Clostridium formicaceticum]AOY75537.1 hypothetical protein BJL90_06280 [Clostridium formicaceticum]ARE85831.1 Lipoteichoic acid synthase 2 [Clostridium formicaceticum]